MDYGTGAIFGCPAHDQRDLDFVNKYGLGNMPVVCPPGQDPNTFVITDTAYDGDGRMINSRFLDGMTVEQAKEEAASRLEKEIWGYRLQLPLGTEEREATTEGPATLVTPAVKDALGRPISPPLDRGWEFELKFLSVGPWFWSLDRQSQVF